MNKVTSEFIFFRRNRAAEKTAMDFARATGYGSYTFGIPGLPGYPGQVHGLPLGLPGGSLPGLPPAMYPGAPGGIPGMGLAGYASALSQAQAQAAMRQLQSQIYSASARPDPLRGGHSWELSCTALKK